jgi:phosphate/sulfate permease
VISAASAISLGTFTGGWRIIRRSAPGSSTWTRPRDSRLRAPARR